MDNVFEKSTYYSPFRRAGHDENTVFEVIANLTCHNMPVGTHVKLEFDDGTISPKFRSLDGTTSCYITVSGNLKPTSMKTLPASREELIFLAMLVGNTVNPPNQTNLARLYTKICGAAGIGLTLTHVPGLRIDLQSHHKQYEQFLERILPEKYENPNKKKLDELIEKRLELESQINELQLKITKENV